MSAKEDDRISGEGLSTSAGRDTVPISRRKVLASTGAIGAALAGGLAFAADGPGHEHAAHAPRYPDALEAANDCSEKARLCLAHCLVSFQEGDTTLATCARSVNAMISLCDAFWAQVANNSSYIKGIAEVCRASCVDCEKECRKHEDDHVECRESADACARLVAAIDNL